MNEYIKFSEHFSRFDDDDDFVCTCYYLIDKLTIDSSYLTFYSDGTYNQCDKIKLVLREKINAMNWADSEIFLNFDNEQKISGSLHGNL